MHGVVRHGRDMQIRVLLAAIIGAHSAITVDS